MSVAAATERPKRSRKPVKRLGDFDDATNTEGDDTSSSDESDDDSGSRKRKKKANTVKRKKTKKSQDDDFEPNATIKRALKTAPRKRGRKKANANISNEDQQQEQEQEQDFPVQDKEAQDLFASVLDTSASIDEKLETWVTAYQSEDDSNKLLTTLINFMFQSCGTVIAIDKAQVSDIDNLEISRKSIENKVRKTKATAFPLSTKEAKFKGFRKRLSEFVFTLVEQAHESEILYDEFFIDVIVAWVNEFSTSQLRNFRHTFTVIALELMSALCNLRTTTVEELEKASKTRDTEENKARPNKKRLQELTEAVDVANDKHDIVQSRCEDLFQNVYSHRWHDSDASIRIECIQELTNWMRMDPDRFMNVTYFQYLGWSFNDSNPSVRVDSLKGITPLLNRGSGSAPLRMFLERFRKRFAEISYFDKDVSSRVAAIQVLHSLDKHYGLDEEMRTDLAKLLFSTETRVRRKVASFWNSIIDQEVSDKHVVATKKKSLKSNNKSNVTEYNAEGKNEDEEEQENSQDDEENDEKEEAQTNERKVQLNFKCLALLLMAYGVNSPINESKGDNAQDEEELDDDDEAGMSTVNHNSHLSIDIVSAMKSVYKGRVNLAVDALWRQVDSLSEWHDLVSLLKWDHSSFDEDSQDQQPLDEYRRLSEAEETLLIEILVNCIRLSKHDAEYTIKNGKDRDKEPAQERLADITRVMIADFPKLLYKHRTHRARVTELLLIPPLMNFEMYIDLRDVTAYEKLWDDIMNQFLNWNDLVLLEHALLCIKSLMNADCLKHINTDKLSQLQQKLGHALSDVVGKRDLTNASLEADDVLKIEWNLSRLSLLSAEYDISALLTENDNSSSTTLLSTIQKLSSRANLGYKEEEKMVENSIHVLYTYSMWKLVDLQAQESEVTVEFNEFIKSFIKTLEDVAIEETSYARTSVKHAALNKYLELHILLNSFDERRMAQNDLHANISKELNETIQYRCVTLVQEAIDKYTSELEERTLNELEGDMLYADEENYNAKSSSDTHDSVPKPRNVADVKITMDFDMLISVFARSINTGVIDSKHGICVLANFGRFGNHFDSCCRVIVEALREEGIYEGHPKKSVLTAVSALKEAAALYFDNIVKTEATLIGLGKLLVHAFVVRGAQLSIIDTIPTPFLIQYHNEIISFAIEKVASADNDYEGDVTFNKAYSLFKCLLNAVVSLGPEDARRIHEHLSEELSQSNLDTQSLDGGEPLKSYEKRLVKLGEKNNNEKKKETVNQKQVVVEEDLPQTEMLPSELQDEVAPTDLEIDEVNDVPSEIDVEETLLPDQENPQEDNNEVETEPDDVG